MLSRANGEGRTVWFRRKQPIDDTAGPEVASTGDRDPLTPFPANLAHAIAWGASLESVGYEWPSKDDSPMDGDTVEETTTEL